MEMNEIIFSWRGFAITAPLLAYIVYSIWRDKLRRVVAALRFLRWVAITFFLAIFVNVVLFAGELAYLVAHSCDEFSSPVATNSRGDIAGGVTQVCTFIGTGENYYITLQSHTYPRFWPRKKLIEYSPVGDRHPIPHWINDNTLTVDLGKVYSVWSQVNKVGNIRITYVYTKVDSDGS